MQKAKNEKPVAMMRACWRPRAATETAGSGNAVNSSLEGLRPPDAAAGAAGTETTDDGTVARMLDESERLYNDLWSMGGERSSVDDPEAATAAKPAASAVKIQWSVCRVESRQFNNRNEPNGALTYIGKCKCLHGGILRKLPMIY